MNVEFTRKKKNIYNTCIKTTIFYINKFILESNNLLVKYILINFEKNSKKLLKL